MAKSLEAEQILDTRVSKKTIIKEYLEYLVKWKGCLMEDSNWMDEEAL
ncbi:chromo domain-containing protein [Escherichia coli]